MRGLPEPSGSGPRDVIHALVQRGVPAITSAKPYPGVKRDSGKLKLMEDYEQRKCATSNEYD
jgi:hypothetical protein